MTLEYDFQKILNLYNSKQISKQDGINLIAELIHRNPSYFDLLKYDEDFKSNVILKFIQSGYFVFEKYNPEYGSFSNYVKSFIRNFSKDEQKKYSRRVLIDSIIEKNCINDYTEKEELYRFLDRNIFEIPQVPYSYPEMSPTEMCQNLKKFMATKQYNTEKKMVSVILLKYCFYITDHMIHGMTKLTGLEADEIYEAILFLKNSIPERSEKHKIIEDRRNAAFFRYSKYKEKLSDEFLSDHQREELKKSLELQKKSWELNSEKLASGAYKLFPTNKNISLLLGISERQVSYYISNAKKLAEELIDDDNDE